MTKLHNDWLTEGLFDFEYKKYVLLAYLQHIDGQFNMNRLYPHLPDLKSHLNSCVTLQKNKNFIRSSFPKDLKGLNTTDWKLVYEDTHQEDAYLSDLNYILEFAIPKFSKALGEGAERLSEVGENIRISPVGIVPLRVEEGYLFFVHTYERMVSVFRYQLALYNELKERYLKTIFIDTIRTSMSTTLEQIKIDLVKSYSSWPNPATYAVESKYDYPLHETLLPVAERLIIRQMNIA